MAIAAATLVSCGGNAPKASLKTDVDTLSYAIGVAQSQGLNNYLSQAKGVDTTYIAEFINGLTDGVNAGDDKKKAAYYAGVEIGQQMQGQMLRGINMSIFGDDSTQSISLQNMVAGFISAVAKKDMKMTVKEADSVANLLAETIKARAMESKYSDNKKKGEDFLAENAKKDSVVTLPSGEQYKIIKQGDGVMPADTNQV